MATALRYRAPAPMLFVIGAVSMYAGAALAVGLFSLLAPAAVAVLRMLGAAAVLLAWRRPAAVAWRGPRLVRAAAFGLATAGMNIAFYEAIARLPLGTAVAVEFCGPVAVAAVASRRPRDIAAVVLAAVGVALIADVRWSGSPSGVAVGARGGRAVGGLHRARQARGGRRERPGRHGRRLRGGRGGALAAAAARRRGRPGSRRWPTRSCCCWRSASACCRAWCPTCSTRSCCAGWGRPASRCCWRCSRHRDDRRPDRAAAGAQPARGGRDRGRRRGRQRCGRETATLRSRWADRADDHERDVGSVLPSVVENPPVRVSQRPGG